MTTTPKVSTSAPPTRRFNVTEYYRMGEVGIFHPEERLELIEGVIMLKSPPASIPAPRKFTVAEYYRLGEAGIIEDGERVELINGEILLMAPIGDRHAGRVDRWTNYFAERARGRYIVRVQNPVVIGERQAPQPDLVLLRPRPDFYETSAPGPEDILLIIEVSDSSLPYDRNVKAPLYAGHDIPETWLMNLVDDCIERFTRRGPGGYERHSVHRRGERITPEALPDLEILVDDLLPPAPPAETNPTDSEETG